MTNNRRNFLKQTSLLIAGAAVLPNFACSFTNHAVRTKNIGLQLYSLRNLLPKDVNGVIAEVAKAGFSYVETYGYNIKDNFWGLSPQDFKSLLKANGLKAPSGHYDLDSFLSGKNADELKATIEAASTLGSEYVTVPYLQDNLRKNMDDYKRVAAKINEAGNLCKQNGLRIAYHNHDFEFLKIGESTGMEVLLAETDRNLVDFEMDIYWVVKSGKDPIQLTKDYPGRFKMLHIKDMDKTNKNLNTEVGSGAIDFIPIFENAKTAGIKHFFVEHETNYKPNELASVKASLAYIQKNLL